LGRKSILHVHNIILYTYTTVKGPIHSTLYIYIYDYPESDNRERVCIYIYLVYYIPLHTEKSRKTSFPGMGRGWIRSRFFNNRNEEAQTEGKRNDRFFVSFCFLLPRAWRRVYIIDLPKFLWRSLVSRPDVKFMVLGVKRFYNVVVFILVYNNIPINSGGVMGCVCVCV
jgi:hypothetical protein